MFIQNGVMRMTLGQDIPFMYPSCECIYHKHAKLVFVTFLLAHQMA
jgi:hypothetical protein